ncbi:hypothetical protein GS982_32075 [Rhodococcus hoagii]|uniref:Uncharacterized protein n=1 Tax=Rhodococcus hoagii TaxID=43767 RepID=A0A9Q4ZIT3_RHOHA|nr:hypothetical protein [Prescottella equi]NKT77315.1 hypothetical protein [Prescottella equi]NKZ81102.1 hypothetical protein [Prescottella equi]NKZ86576.1 hypothetical protein [Prescottella equi]NKZ86582.1 hypothetical protein [Prescottella equi]
MIATTLIWIFAGLILLENARLRYKLRKPRLEFDCDDDRHMWGQVERVPGGNVHWMQGRSCQLCSFEQVLGATGKWGPSIGSSKK